MKSMDNLKCQRCGFDRRFEDDRRDLYNVMPLGYDKRRNKVERRSPLERRQKWVRHTRWGSVGPEHKQLERTFADTQYQMAPPDYGGGPVFVDRP